MDKQFIIDRATLNILKKIPYNDPKRSLIICDELIVVTGLVYSKCELEIVVDQTNNIFSAESIYLYEINKILDEEYPEYKDYNLLDKHEFNIFMNKCVENIIN